MSNEEEVWKIYPDYPWIEASNLGRVRTKDRTVIGRDGKEYHIKGRVLRQHLQKNGYVYVSFKVNGKHVHLLVHRIVATCFLLNDADLPEVDHIDNNPKNNSVSNLRWCTHQENIAYREKYGTPAKEYIKASRKPVFAVNLETFEALPFESQSEAARQLGIDVGDINKVVRGKKNTAGGCWFTEDESEITEGKIQEIKNNMYLHGGVVAISSETSKVFLFESQHEAARQLGVNQGNIANVLKGRQNKTGDYCLFYADENVIKKVRMKFGNEVANKVEKLMRES